MISDRACVYILKDEDDNYMKNNKIFMMVTMFMALHAGFAGASELELFDENENLYNFDDCLISSEWNISNELDGDLMAILADPVPVDFIGNALIESNVTSKTVGKQLQAFLSGRSTVVNSERHSQRSPKQIQYYSDDDFTSSYVQVPMTVKKESTQLKKPIVTKSVSTWKINPAENFKFSADVDERTRQRAAFIRNKQKSAATIAK